MNEETFAIELTDSAKTRLEWLSMMRFGMKSLLDNPQLLMECIVRRAERELSEAKGEAFVIADFARPLFRDLGIKFTLCD